VLFQIIVMLALAASTGSRSLLVWSDSVMGL